MALIRRSRYFEARVEKIVEVLENLTRIPEYAPGAKCVEGAPTRGLRAGDSFKVHCALMGLHVPIRFTVKEVVPYQRVVTGMAGGMRGTCCWTLDPYGTFTVVTVEISYEMVGGVIGKALDILLVERINASGIDRMLNNLKILCEANVRVRATSE
jgi:hypothetical protein